MSWYHHIPGFRLRRPLRAGVLNTGELVLIDDTGHAQIFGDQTTDLIRDVLAADEQRVIDSVPLDHSLVNWPGTQSAGNGEAHEGPVFAFGSDERP